MKNSDVIKSLLGWMEKHLHKGANFNDSAIANYFAENFIINTNGRIVEATPSTYKEYLYKLKSKLNSVTYDVKELFEASNNVVTTFIIHMNFTEKEAESLLAISIFKFNERGRITEWQGFLPMPNSTIHHINK